MDLHYTIFKRNHPHKKEVKETILEAFPSNERLPFLSSNISRKEKASNLEFTKMKLVSSPSLIY